MTGRTDKGVWFRVVARTRPWRARLGAAIFASLIAAAAGATWASLVGPMLRALMNGGGAKWGPFTFERADLVFAMPLLIIGAAVLKALASFIHAGLTGAVAQGVLAQLRRDLYGRLLSLPPKWFEQRHSGELLSRFTADVAQLEFSAAQALASISRDTLQVLALLVVCFLADWRLFLVTFIVLPGTIIPVSRFARSARKQATSSQASLGQLSLIVNEHLSNLPVVQAYRAEPRALKTFDDEQNRYLAVMKKSLFVRGAFSPTTEFLGVLGVAAAIVLGVRLVQDDPSFGDRLLTFLAAALFLYQPVKSLSNTASQVSLGAGAATRLFEVLDAQPEPDAGAVAAPLARALRFEDVSLTWADGRTALNGLSFEIAAGQHVALVGPSGAGKSSAVALLLGHALPSGGSLTWDGAELTTFSRHSLRSRLAWVPQEPVLLSGTVRENLLLGRADATDAQLWTALERAHAADFVKALPAGIEEDVGERGSKLSGGQRQRLAIARAFLKEPSLLILDEPTSALDSATEAEVQAGLEELMKGRTTLVIAHRLATVRHADHIVVINEGRVVEQGNHDELVARGGVYAKLHLPD
ncbi:MAG: ABC transporter ATP-binding protein [Archangium sp.]|nr:ABC transporter ATP-binding protein [Archangium sp.]